MYLRLRSKSGLGFGMRLPQYTSVTEAFSDAAFRTLTCQNVSRHTCLTRSGA